MVAFSIVLAINYFMPNILLSFPNTSSLILICYMLYFCTCILKFFYVCIWTVVCNKGFIYLFIVWDVVWLLIENL